MKNTKFFLFLSAFFLIIVTFNFSVTYAKFVNLTQAQIEKKSQALIQIESSVDLEILNSTVSPEKGKKLLFGKCRKSKLVITSYDPLTKLPRDVIAQVYVPQKKRSKQKTILLLPPTGGENFIDRGYANCFCLEGYQVVIVQSWKDDTTISLDETSHDVGALRAIAAVQVVIKHLRTVSENEIILFGTSVGAITATMVLHLDNFIQKAVFIVGGVGMADIISSSTQSNLKKLRTARMKEFGYTDISDYRDSLEQKLIFDPLYFILATKDSTLATSQQQLLIDTHLDSGSEVFVETLKTNHVKAVVKAFTSKKDKFLKFFKNE